MSADNQQGRTQTRIIRKYKTDYTYAAAEDAGKDSREFIAHDDHEACSKAKTLVSHLQAERNAGIPNQFYHYAFTLQGVRRIEQEEISQRIG